MAWPAALWLSPAIVAVVWWAVLSAALAGAEPADAHASLVFLGGPLLLLAGLHARLRGYLHASERLRHLPLPFAPSAHWSRAHPRRRRGAAATVGLGGAAVCAAAWTGAPADAGHFALAGLVDWGLLVALAGLVEPLVAAVAAHLGRRFPAGHPVHGWQRTLGGGWTMPEAVVHLYAPAFGIALAALLAMPGQLVWRRALVDPRLGAVDLLLAIAPPLAIALTLRRLAPRLYASGMWQAVPWLAEATRSLAGPPLPERSPRWIRLVGDDPLRRLVALQFARLTALPALRLAVVLAAFAFAALRSTPPSPQRLALLACAVGLWLLPARALREQRLARQRLCAALPLAAERRAGRVAVLPALLALPLALAVALALRWSVWS